MEIVKSVDPDSIFLTFGAHFFILKHPTKVRFTLKNFPPVTLKRIPPGRFPSGTVSIENFFSWRGNNHFTLYPQAGMGQSGPPVSFHSSHFIKGHNS
jgi:hypothetical protein